MTHDPLDQDEDLTLEAELRQALQHRRAAQEQADETGRELARLLERARSILGRNAATSGSGDAEGGAAEEAGATEQ